MNRVLAAIAILLLPALAHAGVDEDTAHPGPIGRPHSCPRSMYPASAISGLTEGGAVLGFDIKTDGTVENIHVVTSSGDDALDQASIACVKMWTYHPAMSHGAPVEVSWRARVNWVIPTRTNEGRVADPRGPAYACPERKRDPANTAMPDTAIVDYAIDPEGGTSEVSLASSSGDKVFDAYAVSCVSAWHLKPSRINGVPVRAFKRAAIAWKDTTGQ